MHQGDKPTPEDLRRGPLLQPLTDAQRARCASRALRLRLDDGEDLFRQGAPALRFYLLLRGHMKLYRLSPEGHEKVIEIVTPGSTFAEALMFLRRPHYPVSATAIGQVELVSLDAVDFHAMLTGSVETCLLLLGDMSRRLRGLIGEIDDLSLHSATCRVAAYLARRAQQEGQCFDLGVPKQVIASRLSVQPETLSRTLRSLAEAGVIRVEGGRLEVLSQSALEAAAGE